MSQQICKDFRGRIRGVLRCGILVTFGFTYWALATPLVVAVQPCCTITKIDLATGVATAKVIATGQTFQFKVADAALLHSLKVGQGIFANLKTRQVSINNGQPCCDIISLGKVGGAGNTAAGRNLGNSVNPIQPCCDITSIDAATGTVTAKVNATGQTFQFKVADAVVYSCPFSPSANAFRKVKMFCASAAYSTNVFGQTRFSSSFLQGALPSPQALAESQGPWERCTGCWPRRSTFPRGRAGKVQTNTAIVLVVPCDFKTF